MSRSKDWEQRLAQVERQVRLYQKISRWIAKSAPLGEALDAIAGLVAEFTHSDSCLIYLLSEGELVLCAASGSESSAAGHVRLRLDEGLTGWVAREKRLLAISREAYSDSRFKYFRALPQDTFEAFLSAPATVRQRVVGVLNLQHRDAHQHTGDEMEMITTAGEQIGALVAIACLDAAQFNRGDFASLALASRLVQHRR